MIFKLYKKLKMNQLKNIKIKYSLLAFAKLHNFPERAKSHIVSLLTIPNQFQMTFLKLFLDFTLHYYVIVAYIHYPSTYNSIRLNQN